MSILKIIYGGPPFRLGWSTVLNIKFIVWVVFNICFILKELKWLIRYNSW